MRISRALPRAALMLAALMLPAPMAAQNGPQLAQRGINAYRALEYDKASRLLEQARRP